MSQQPSKNGKQAGIALIALLVMLILAGAYALYRGTNGTSHHQQEKGKQLLQLNKAKEALIAYAVVDPKRPGRLLCPDLIGDGISPLLSRDDCDSYGGQLPWKTLDLTEGVDSTGAPLRYYLSPLFGGDRKTPVLNSDTETSLRVDLPKETPSNDIAAIIIAPRGALDSGNSDGDDYFYNGKSEHPEDNDLVITITRQELMAAVEQRIANEIRTCLEQHASSTKNPEHTYPWPAPLASSNFAGTTGSLFGMIPSTQAGNPDKAIEKSNTDLKRLKNALATASTTDSQLTILLELADTVSYARSLYDRLYAAAADLQAKARTARSKFKTLDSEILSATADSTAFKNGAASLPIAIQDKLPSLEALNKSLANLGMDIFVMEAIAQNETLQTAINDAARTPDAKTLGALQSQSNIFQNKLFRYSATPNSEIAVMLEASMLNATKASQDALQAKKYPGEGALVTQALNSAYALHLTTEALISLIQNNRVSTDGREFNSLSDGILLAVRESGSSAKGIASLRSVLEISEVKVTSLAALNGVVASAKSTAQTAIHQAINATQAPDDQNAIQQAVLTAIGALNTLASALTHNGDNIAIESLKLATNTLSISGQVTPTSIVAAEALREPTKAIVYWADLADRHASEVARLARKGVSADYDSNSSAYTAARKLLDDLDGKTGATYLLEQYIADDSAANRRAALAALAKTRTSLNALLNRSEILGGFLESGLANAAVPVIWYSEACSLLKPASATSLWWETNNWANFFFYQISDRNYSTAGRLTVNGRGKHKLIVLSSGKPIADQNRGIRETKNFLEEKNSDPTRDGEATAPVTQFSSAPVSHKFNDRLAY